MDEELEIDPEYKKGFNDGYILQRGDDKVAEEYLERRRKKPEEHATQRDKGLRDGILQARIETMQRDLDEIFDIKKNRKHGFKH